MADLATRPARLRAAAVSVTPGLRPVTPAALLLAAGATLVGGMRANTFSVVETEIALHGLDRDVVAMQLSDIHLGHHRGRKYFEKIVEESNQRSLTSC